jgi:prepilin-type N-terminal cleavage/methylation domain-containing protein
MPHVEMPSKSSPRAQRQKGFTLIEVLIALAITSMVVAVLMSSVFYGAKVQSSIRDELVAREQSLRGKAWFSQVLSGCLPAEAAAVVRPGQAPANIYNSAFAGSAKEVVCETLSPIKGARVLPALKVKLALRQTPNASGFGGSDSQQLTYQQVGSSDAAVVIADLPAGTPSFSFFGTRGVEVEQWPVNQGDTETLPRRIHLKVKSGTAEKPIFEWFVSVSATPWVEPVLRTPFGGPVPR